MERNKGRAAIHEQARRMERDLSAIKRVMRKPLEADIARGRLTMPQAAVMEIVVDQQGISLKDLSREVSLAHSTVSGIADRLEKKGLIERRADPADGRVARIYPTPIVVEYVRERIPMMASEPLVEALTRASAEERAGMEQSLRRLRELLERPEDMTSAG